ncbi:UPF0223 family protein [Cytobacillus sp. FSL W7-1323]|uniref:UPF0223 protein CKF48_01385 n=1 Tax=Cytobacillus kochii TaxID=859143 RepID=A0A248TD27_9BACI|nr:MULTISPECIES: UPF0223 family protein [Cytobacillus]ASV66097.1 hypothetical protein CKF48_01385 [Cytobacillus kochii]MCA1027626.1 UPF0223 family protein [Cytobacillus kochii]MCM3321865.1 UPF0223 family protein [Cytobacillus kochii]MCM3343301.1 UPF0223 family protein [Cytobacillus kochii]MDM5207131.1 UPF0223 family protein [Cytobacillus kochii]
MEYQYPMESDWSTEEIIDAIAFFQAVEKAYEKGIQREDFMAAYRRFKEIVPGKAQERNLCNDFEEISGYSSYRTVQMAKKADESSKIKM